ncbi:MAG: universal stress protein [Anaerolineales bacterium]|nr:universal stress protein [Anaerolineales bacterium]
MFKYILLGVDGSEHALRAARTAGELARLTGAELRVVVSFDPVPPYLGEPFLDRAMSDRLKSADEILKPALKVIGDIPGELHTEVLEGPAGEAILNVADARKSDLIIMGTRGLGRLATLLVGSQSQKVISNATCPVLLVR